MGRGKVLSESEKEIIKVLHAQGESGNRISNIIQRSRCVVQNYLKSPENYAKKKKSGRKKLINKRLRNIIFEKATRENLNASQIKAEMDLPVSTRCIRNIIKENGRAVYKKMAKIPDLKEHHIKARLAWAKKYMDYGDNWKNVIFSDEKKFNLDGPDGFKFYWHDIKDESKEFLSRKFHGGGIMIWGAFRYYGKIHLQFITQKIDSKEYLNMLERSINEFEALLGKNFEFQQDNAPVHTSEKCKKWFRDNNIKLIDWPAHSPDMNPIENLWGILARDVYKNGRQFENVEQLKMQILHSWTSIKHETLRKLVNSMRDRLFALINANGNKTKY